MILKGKRERGERKSARGGKADHGRVSVIGGWCWLALAKHSSKEYNPQTMNESGESDYLAALEYLLSFVDYSLSRTIQLSPAHFDLTRMAAFLEHLGNPQEAYPSIHIAGTKGKGSVTALCASVLQEAGYRVGQYTSPHMDDFVERICINGVMMPHAELVSLVEEIKPIVTQIPRLTTFEITTGLALLYFARQKVDFAVVEVGLGGRLDATNVITPRVSVITSISYDHTAVLGNTLAEIAAEKGGIIKPRIPVVLAPQAAEARRVLVMIAEQRGAPLVQLGQDYFYAPISHTLNGQSFYVWSRDEQLLVDEYVESNGEHRWAPTRLSIPLLGIHQVENAATAYAALHTLKLQGVSIREVAIQVGFARTSWPGRFEILRQSPPVVVDSAHNPDSALRLRLALEDYFPGLPVILVFGASEDKDVQGMFAELLPRVRQVIAVKSFHPRAMEPERLVELAHQFGRPARIVMDVADGLDEALLLAGKEAVVLVTGSIFVVAGARIAWQAKHKSRDLTLMGAMHEKS